MPLVKSRGWVISRAGGDPLAVAVLAVTAGAVFLVDEMTALDQIGALVVARVLFRRHGLPHGVLERIGGVDHHRFVCAFSLRCRLDGAARQQQQSQGGERS